MCEFCGQYHQSEPRSKKQQQQQQQQQQPWQQQQCHQGQQYQQGQQCGQQQLLQLQQQQQQQQSIEQPRLTPEQMLLFRKQWQFLLQLQLQQHHDQQLRSQQQQHQILRHHQQQQHQEVEEDGGKRKRTHIPESDHGRVKWQFLRKRHTHRRKKNRIWLRALVCPWRHWTTGSKIKDCATSVINTSHHHQQQQTTSQSTLQSTTRTRKQIKYFSKLTVNIYFLNLNYIIILVIQSTDRGILAITSVLYVNPIDINEHTEFLLW